MKSWARATRPMGEVATDLEASRLLYRAAAQALGTPEGPVMAAHAKRFVPDAALKAATTCIQVLGGMGLLTPYGLDRLSRLAQILRIVDGTTEVARLVIGRALQKRAADLPDVPEPTGGGGPQKPEKLSRRRQDTLVDTVRSTLLCRW
jgi:alkylation response protein AidB-like acyl-CoA dehydrogenase